MADVESKVVITAQNNTGSAFSSMTGGLDGMIGKLGALGAAYLTVNAIAGGAKWLVDITSKSIEAAGHLNDLSQSTGVSATTLSNYALSAKQAGTDIDGLAGGLQKLNVKIDDAAGGGKEASLAFSRLGVDIKDASGEVRSTEDILGDVAEKFSGMEDGASKTALAIDIFGKSGAALLPFLNQGKEGLNEAAEAAKALGLSLSAETVSAADLAGDAIDGVKAIAGGLGNKIMAEVIPTIMTMTRSFTEFIIETGALDIAAAVVGGAFKSLVAAGQIVYGVFATLGNVIGGTASALKLFVEGEYSKAWDALKGGFNDAGTSITNMADNVRIQWTTTAADVAKANDNKAVPSLNRLKAAHKEVKAEVDKGAEAQQKFFETIEDKIVEVENEIRAGEKATEVDKARTKYLADLERGTIKATESEKAAALAMLDRWAAGVKALENEKDRLKLQGELAKMTQDYAVALGKEITEVEKEIAKQKEANAEIGLTKEQVGELTAKRYEEMAALVNQRIEQNGVIVATGAEYDALVTLSNGYKTLAAEVRSGATRQAIVDSAEEAKKAWEETAKTIESSLTDALMRGFEDGKGFLQNLIATTKNLFNTLVLKPIIQAVVNPVAGGITGVLGLTGTANAAGGAGGGSGILGSLGSLGGLFGAGGAGGALMAGAGWLTGATSLTGALGAAGSLIGTGTLGGTMSGLAMGAGALAPFVLGAFALNSIFGKKRGGPKLGGSFSTTGERLFTPSGADTEAAQLGQSALGSISELAGLLGGSSAGLSLGIGFDSDPQGTAGNRISSFLRDASGRTIFDNIIGRDVGRDDAALQSGLGDETAKLILAGLQASDLPADIKDYFGKISVATFTAAQLDSTIAGAKALLPKDAAAEPSLLDRALEDPGTYTAVSTEVRELVTLQQEHIEIAKEQRDAQLKAGDLLLAQLDQAKNAFIRLIEAADRGALNTARLVDLGVASASAPQLVRVV